jgi:hypothetical protein
MMSKSKQAITKKYQFLQEPNKGTLLFIYYLFELINPPANKPNTRPIISPIFTLFKTKPINTPIIRSVLIPIRFLDCILYLFEGKARILANKRYAPGTPAGSWRNKAKLT